MEFGRDCRKQEMGNWGTLLAERMALTEKRAPRQREAPKVRMALAEMPPVLQDVELKRQKLDGLDSRELAELCRKCHLFRSIDLSGWQGVTLLSFRSLCLAIGGSLQTLSNLGVRALVEYCKKTLTSIDLSGCAGLNDEAVAYLGGAIGFGTCCALLQSLSLADCKRMSDASLKVLSKGCPRLRFLNLSGCDKVTTKGVKRVAEGCRNMAVLNLYHCSKVQNGALVALSKHCPRLVSLNVALIGRVKDSGVSALSRGCRSLQALNIAGAKEVTEGSICNLAQNCSGLHTLNMTGCVEVGLGGLHGLIEGVGESLVKEAKTFFGFIPRKSMIDNRIEESQKAIELAAIRAIQKYWRDYKRRLANAFAIAHAQADAAACTIQAAYYRYKKKLAWWEKRLLRKHNKAALEIQRVYRAHRVRLRANILREEKRALLAKGNRAVPVQAIFRGFMVRRDDKLIGPAIRGMLEEREQEIRHAAAVRLQARVRAWIGLKRCTAWGEVRRQRLRDIDISSRIIQGGVRCFLARILLSKLRMQRETRKEIERRAAIVIQSFWRGCIGKNTSAMVKSQMARITRARHRTAIKLQAAFRGHQGRLEWRKMHREQKKKSKAARKIQKVFRGSRVMSWRDVRLNKVAQHVFMRQEMEYQERLDGGRSRFQYLVDEADRDSCSDENDEADANEQWEEVWEEGADHSYWWNPVLRESSIVKPMAFEEGLVGMRVWLTRPTSAGLTGKGHLTRLNRKRVKHRLEFDSGGRKWIDINEEQDTMMVYSNGAWVQLKNVIEPAAAEARARKEMLSRRRRANQHLFDKEQRWEHVYDEATGKLRYHDPKTGEVILAKEDATKWTMEQDDVGDIIFFHRETQEVVYDDPRFENGGKKERDMAKLKCLEDARFARYFCDQLCDRRQLYEENRLGAKERRLLLESLSSGDSALRLSTAITSARSVFRERELQENDELQAAMLLGKYMHELKVWAQAEMEVAALQKARFLTGGSASSLSDSKSSRWRKDDLEQQEEGHTSDFYQTAAEKSMWYAHDDGSSDNYLTYGEHYNNNDYAYDEGEYHGEQYAMQPYTQGEKT